MATPSVIISNNGSESFGDWQAVATPAQGSQTSISPPCKAVYVGTNGTLSLTGVDGDTIDALTVNAGQIHHFIAISMGNDGSGATGIIALY